MQNIRPPFGIKPYREITEKKFRNIPFTVPDISEYNKPLIIQYESQ